MVIDCSGDATAGADLQVIWGLVLALAEVEADRFIHQPKFFENDGDFPENQIDFRTVVTSEGGGTNLPAVGFALPDPDI